MSVYIMCPANLYTGGPTLAHQLCYILNKNGIEAKMWYYHKLRDYYNPFKNINNIDPVHNNYKCFLNPYTVNQPDDIKGNIIVALEANITILNSFKFAKRIIWWMSVDNFFLNMGRLQVEIRKRLFHIRPTLEYCKQFKDEKKYQVFRESGIIHLVQSEYARLFLLEERINPENIFELSDYIEDEVINAHSRVDIKRKKNTILYNPKKGLEFTKKIINNNSQYEWIPLIGMNKSQIISNLLDAKIYIDFGNHPGKDRFPREAVLCGCCVITGRRGAARNDIDIPIDNKYKFEDLDDNLESISTRIQDILDNYEIRIKDFDIYINRTLLEKMQFEKQAVKIFGLLPDVY